MMNNDLYGVGVLLILATSLLAWQPGLPDPVGAVVDQSNTASIEQSISEILEAVCIVAECENEATNTAAIAQSNNAEGLLFIGSDVDQSNTADIGQSIAQSLEAVCIVAECENEATNTAAIAQSNNAEGLLFIGSDVDQSNEASIGQSIAQSLEAVCIVAECENEATNTAAIAQSNNAEGLLFIGSDVDQSNEASIGQSIAQSLEAVCIVAECENEATNTAAISQSNNAEGLLFIGSDVDQSNEASIGQSIAQSLEAVCIVAECENEATNTAAISQSNNAEGLLFIGSDVDQSNEANIGQSIAQSLDAVCIVAECENEATNTAEVTQSNNAEGLLFIGSDVDQSNEANIGQSIAQSLDAVCIVAECENEATNTAEVTQSNNAEGLLFIGSDVDQSNEANIGQSIAQS